MSDDTKPDYRETVFLPKTDFPMKAGLPQKEPGIAAKWEAEKLYERLRDSRALAAASPVLLALPKRQIC